MRCWAFFLPLALLVGTVQGQSKLRLVNGQKSWEGRVEIYVSGTWGTVCDDSWDNTDAAVVCRQLGLNTSLAQAFNLARFGSGSSGIHLDEVTCRGYESRLIDCPANPVGTNDCGHSEDAGVACYPLTTGNTCQGQCQNHCGTTGLTRHGSGGKTVNMAYNKSADMSSVHEDSRGVSGSACMAVNGRTYTTYRTPTEAYTNCIQTAAGDRAAYWWVDLGRQYTITDITIYRRADPKRSFQRMLAGLSVLVENERINQTCYQFSNSTNIPQLDAFSAKIDITCEPPLTGRKVWLQKHGQDSNPIYYPISICEVQVWVCRDGLYGKHCAQECSGNCKNGSVCDNYYGTCPAGCREGYTGADCRCGHCRYYAICDVTNSTCPDGCAEGWQGVYCDQRVDTGSYDSYDSDSDSDVGLITGVCVGGFVILVVVAAAVFVFRRPRQRSSLASSGKTKTACAPRNQIELPVMAAAAAGIPQDTLGDEDDHYDIEDDNIYEVAENPQASYTPVVVPVMPPATAGNPQDTLGNEGEIYEIEDDNIYDAAENPQASYTPVVVPVMPAAAAGNPRDTLGDEEDQYEIEEENIYENT